MGRMAFNADRHDSNYYSSVPIRPLACYYRKRFLRGSAAQVLAQVILHHLRNLKTSGLSDVLADAYHWQWLFTGYSPLS
jgi:hypothetical protein